MSNGNNKYAKTVESLYELARLAESTAVITAAAIEKASALVTEALQHGGKVLACGNGGSAADAQHLVGELVGSFLVKRTPLPAITLSADTSVLTAIGNDYGFHKVFSRQVECLGNSGDVLVAFSTSGQSPNIIHALETARIRNMKTIAIIGQQGNPVVNACDVCISIQSGITPRIQEMHTAILHAICEKIEKDILVNPARR